MLSSSSSCVATTSARAVGGRRSRFVRSRRSSIDPWACQRLLRCSLQAVATLLPWHAESTICRSFVTICCSKWSVHPRLTEAPRAPPWRNLGCCITSGPRQLVLLLRRAMRRALAAYAMVRRLPKWTQTCACRALKRRPFHLSGSLW